MYKSVSYMHKGLIEDSLENPKSYDEYRKFIECWHVITETSIARFR